MLSKSSRDIGVENRFGFGKTGIINFHSCICQHQDTDHDAKTGECKYCLYKKFLRCKRFRPDTFCLVLVFDDDIEKKTI